MSTLPNFSPSLAFIISTHRAALCWHSSVPKFSEAAGNCFPLPLSPSLPPSLVMGKHGKDTPEAEREAERERGDLTTPIRPRPPSSSVHPSSSTRVSRPVFTSVAGAALHDFVARYFPPIQRVYFSPLAFRQVRLFGCVATSHNTFRVKCRRD